jgi:hypothetical protein
LIKFLASVTRKRNQNDLSFEKFPVIFPVLRESGVTTAAQYASLFLLYALRVTRGLDPRVHLPRRKMDCRVKPGNDAEFYGSFSLANP